MTTPATRTITIEVPASWYVAEDAYGTPRVWQDMPGRTLCPEPVGDLQLVAAMVAALPRMQWGVQGHTGWVTRVASEAQAAVTAWESIRDEMEGAVDTVCRLYDGCAWRYVGGVSADESGESENVDDGMLSPADARRMLRAAARWVASGTDPDAADHLAALRREAEAHGHDLAALEG